MKLNELKALTSSIAALAPSDDRNSVYDHLRSIGIDPSNFYQELEMSSRYVDTHQDVSYSNDHLSLHSHYFYEILFCRNAKGVEYLVGPDRYLLQKGDIIFVPPASAIDRSFRSA